MSVVPESVADSLPRTRSQPEPHFLEYYDTQRPQRAVMPHHPPFSKPLPSKWDDAQKWIASPTANRPLTQPRKVSRQSSTKHLLEVSHYEEIDTKLIDTSQVKKDLAVHKFVSWEVGSDPVAESHTKPVLMIENSVAETASKFVLTDFSFKSRSYGYFDFVFCKIYE